MQWCLQVKIYHETTDSGAFLVSLECYQSWHVPGQKEDIHVAGFIQLPNVTLYPSPASSYPDSQPSLEDSPWESICQSTLWHTEQQEDATGAKGAGIKCLLAISYRAETKVNPRKVSDSRRKRYQVTEVPQQLQITWASARLGKGFPKAPFIKTTPAPNSGAALPGHPPAALLSIIVGTKQKPAWIKGPEWPASGTQTKR